MTGSTPAGQPLGFIGLGEIGRPVARRLLQAGHEVVGYDLAPAALEAAAADGVLPAASPREVAAACATVFACLPTSDDVEAACLGPDGLADGAAPGTLLIDLTSGRPSTTVALAAQLKERGIDMIDAPVSGSGGAAAAETGTLTVIVGASEALLGACRPLLETFGRRIIHVGPVGAGHLAKALNNVLVATAMISTAEVVVTGMKAGLDPQALVAAIQGSSGRNFATEHRFPEFVLKGDFSRRSGGAIKFLHKDLGQALAVAAEGDVPMPLGTLVHELVGIGVAEYGPDSASTSVARLYERWGEVTFGDGDGEAPA